MYLYWKEYFLETVLEKINDKTMDAFDKKLSEADVAIKNGARFYTRDEADKIIDLFIKK